MYIFTAAANIRSYTYHYSPDSLAMCNFFLFPKLKSNPNDEDIEKNTMEGLRPIETWWNK